MSLKTKNATVLQDKQVNVYLTTKEMRINMEILREQAISTLHFCCTVRELRDERKSNYHVFYSCQFCPGMLGGPQKGGIKVFISFNAFQMAMYFSGIF